MYLYFINFYEVSSMNGFFDQIVHVFFHIDHTLIVPTGTDCV